MPLPKEVSFHKLDLDKINKQIDVWIDDDAERFGGGKVPGKNQRRTGFYMDAAVKIRSAVLDHNEVHIKLESKGLAMSDLGKALDNVLKSKNPISIQRADKIIKRQIEQISLEINALRNKIVETDKVLPDEFRGHGKFVARNEFVRIPTNSEDKT